MRRAVRPSSVTPRSPASSDVCGAAIAGRSRPRAALACRLLPAVLVLAAGCVGEGPTADFTWGSICDLVPAATFTADASIAGDAPIAEYHWDFGGGQTAATTEAEARFSGAGPFPVELRVVDADGREDTKTEILDLAACLEVVSIGTEVDGSQITAVAMIRNANNHRPVWVSFLFTIFDEQGAVWFEDVYGGQVPIDAYATVPIGGVDWRQCDAECDKAGEVEVRVTYSESP